jgi:hypothetical protein
MSTSQQGAKAARRQKHLQRQRELKERKALRKKRAAIHGAMGEAAKMVRSKKKGCRDFERNMETLGFVALADTDWPRVGRDVPGDVTAKYKAIT